MIPSFDMIPNNKQNPFPKMQKAASQMEDCLYEQKHTLLQAVDRDATLHQSSTCLGKH